MKIPKTPIAFDYDLWTTEDGKCMVRVKRTGEVSEVDRKVMRILRAEEKRIRRSYGSDSTSEDEDSAEKSSDSVLSLDAMPEDDVKSAAVAGRLPRLHGGTDHRPQREGASFHSDREAARIVSCDDP